MSIRMVLGACALGLSFIAAPVLATSEAEQECRQYAKEDGVPADEMAEYLADCIANLSPDGEEQPESDQPSDER